jgi:hypothetical protein
MEIKMAKVTVKINPKTSEVQYEVEGVQGTSCEELTKRLMEQNEVLEHQYTEEWHVPEFLPDYIAVPDEESS